MTGGAVSRELFRGFDEHFVGLDDVTIRVRVGGTGPALLLLHGYPQTSAMWHRVAPELAERHTVVAADLRGYGASSCPPTDMDHRPYAKRTMAADMIGVMRALGHKRFSVMGHDRGGRVAYRLALDHPSLVDRLVLLDILSTHDQWSAANQSIRLKMFHWAFLAQPAPMPESLIGRDPIEWLDGRFKRGTKARSLDAMHPLALEEYRRCFRDPDHIHATCEDYRAGARCDLADDDADLASGRMIRCPTLLLWASDGPMAEIADPLALWRQWCECLEGHKVDCGHFIAEEAPDALLASVVPFLRR